MGYVCPWTSTLTTLGSPISEVQRVELFEHVADPGLDEITLLAKCRHLGAGVLRGCHPAPQSVNLPFEAAVLFSGPRLLALQPHDGVHEQLDFFFEPIDSVEPGSGRL